jgi:3-hydroxyacyl-CoA dehydrogenase / enoyl-CoA hydratase / 3-hydroxybutyryl-CoA epimerase
LSNRPERFVGLHFFNPVASLELVALVRHDHSTDDALARAIPAVGNNLFSAVRQRDDVAINRPSHFRSAALSRCI